MVSPYLGLAISTVIYTIGSGLIEVLVSQIAESLPNDGSLSHNAKSLNLIETTAVSIK
jgi:hypothetical protein